MGGAISPDPLVKLFKCLVLHFFAASLDYTTLRSFLIADVSAFDLFMSYVMCCFGH